MSGGTSGAVSGDLNLDGIAGGGPISNANLLALVFGNGAVAGAGIVGADMRLVFLLGMSGKSLPTNFCIGAVVWLRLYMRLVFLLGIIGASLPNKLKNLTLNEKK